MTKPLSRFAKRHGLRDRQLCDAVHRSFPSRTMADLGGGVVKLRLSRAGEGKSGGLRSIVLFRTGDRAIYAYGYAKSDRDDIELHELRAFRALARVMLALDREGLDRAMRSGTIREVHNDA